MMKKIFIFVVLMNLLYSKDLYGQSAPLLEQNFKQFLPVSPTSAKLMQDIDYPINYSTGSINLTIPLHTIQTRDFKLPISLRCNTSGIKLGEQSGWIALGWTLQAEPIVTREKKGTGTDEDGYLYYNSQFGSYDKYYMRNIASGGSPDEEADIFYFSTLNTSGKFLFKRPENTTESNLYRPIFFPSQPVKIVTSNIKNGLQIIDADGTKYTFGNTNESKEYTDVSGKNLLTSWKATRIESLQNDVISFSYEPIEKGLSNWISAGQDYIAFEDMSTAEHWNGYVGTHSGLHPVSCGYWLGIDGRIEGYYIPQEYISISPINDSIRYRINNYKLFVPEYPVNDKAPSSYNIYVPTMHVQVLKTIQYANGHITFLTENDCLKEIQIYENNNLLKTVSFRYSTFAYPYQRRLDEIVIVDKITNKPQKYTFEYYDGYSPENFSKPGKSIDYWGYYNGADNKHLVPSFTITAKPSKLVLSDLDAGYPAITTIGGANREPNIICQRQTLKSIVYPTGLKDIFNYELHEYIDPNDNKIKKAGGLRIKEINSYDDQNIVVKKKKFNYKNGIIHNPPRQNLYTQFYSKIYLYGINSVDNRRYRVYTSTTSQSLSNHWGTPVSYNYVEVIEGIGKDTVKTVYKYDHVTNYSLTMGEYQMFNVDYIDEWKNGKIREKSIFSNLGLVIEKNYFNYHIALPDYRSVNETQSSQIYSYNIVVNQSGQSDNTVINNENYYRYTYPLTGNNNIFLNKDTKIDFRYDYDYYFPDSIITEKNIEYGSSDYDINTGNPIKITMRASDGSNLTNEFKYPYHFNTSVTQSMLERNDINKILYENYKSEKSEVQNAEKKIIHDYALQPSGLLPYKLSSLKTNNTLTNTIYDAETYNQYDAQGNVVEYTRKDKVTVTLLWGYQYQRLIAEIVGVNYTRVIENLGVSYDQIQSMTDESLLNLFSTLRRKNIGLITSYTYFPTRGIATKTDTRDVTTYYEYDGLGRLLSIKDTYGKIIEQYDYHFKQ